MTTTTTTQYEALVSSVFHQVYDHQLEWNADWWYDMTCDVLARRLPDADWHSAAAVLKAMSLVDAAKLLLTEQLARFEVDCGDVEQLAVELAVPVETAVDMLNADAVLERVDQMDAAQRAWNERRGGGCL